MVDSVVGSLSIDQPEQQAPVSIDSSNYYPKIPLPLNEETSLAISARAARAAMGVQGKTGLDQPTIKDSIINGQEGQVRQQAAAGIDTQRFQLAKDRLAQGNVSSAEMADVVKLSNPDSVFEENYANEYMKHLDWPANPTFNNRDVPLYYDMTGIPQEYDYVTKNYGSKSLGFTEYLRTLKEDSDYKIGPNAIISNVLSDLMTAGLYGDLKVRQAGVFGPGILTGTNLEEQSLNLYRLALTDFEAAKKQAGEVYNRLALFDPVVANRWVSAMIGQSQSEVFGNNIFTLLNVGGLSSPAARTALKYSTASFSRIVDATKDMTRIPPNVVPPPVAGAAMAGNLPESAIQKIKIDNINRFSGQDNPARELRERLPAFYDIDRTAAAGDQSRLGREMSNRIGDVIENAQEHMYDTVFNAARVNKVPAPTTIETKIREVQRGLADRHRGVDNTVLDISEPLPVEGANVHAFRIAIGTHDGDLFRNTDELLANAKLNGWIEKGSLIETRANKKKFQQLTNLVDGLETQLAGMTQPHARPLTFNEEVAGIELRAGGPVTAPAGPATGFFGKARGPVTPVANIPEDMGVGLHLGASEQARERIMSQIGVIKQKIADLPRHKTGFTIGKQELPYDPDIARYEGEGGLTAERVGTGFYINKLVYLPVEADFTRDALMTTRYSSRTGKQAMKEHRLGLLDPNATTELPPARNNATAWFKALMGRGIGPSPRLSTAEIRARDIAQRGPSRFLQVLEQDHPYKILPRKDRVAFDRMLNYLQKAWNEETNSPGLWFNTPDQIDGWFQTHYRRSPDPKTIEAYFRYKSVVTHDLTMRDLLVGQRKAELNFSQHLIKYTSRDGAADTGFFEGARLHDLPYDYKYLSIVGENRDSSKVMRSRFVKNRDQITADIQSGKAKLIQIADPKSRPLGDLTPRRVEYALVYGNRHEEKPIELSGHVNRLGAGHLMPEYSWYIKQAHVDEGIYEGDKTLMNFLTRAQANEALPHLENVRQAFRKYKNNAKGKLIFSGADREAIERFEGEGGAVRPDPIDEAVEANRHTGIPFWKHYDWYFGRNKLLDLEEPLRVIEADKKIIGVPEYRNDLSKRHLRIERETRPDGNTVEHEIHLVDGTRGQGSLLGRALVEFTGERDAEGIWTMRNRGTQQNPIFAYEPAPYVDPITAMERGYSRIARTMYMSDIQDFSREHWLQQAAPYLQTKTNNVQRDIRENPIHYFHNPVYLPDTPKTIERQLESNRKQALEFSGARNEALLEIRRLGQLIADGIYNKFGDKNKLAVWLMSELPKKRDPVGLIRNLAFQPLLGMYNWAQFATQASTFANVAAISPRQAAAAAIFSAIYPWTKISRDPAFMKALDEKITMMRLPGMTAWKPGWMLEAIDAMENLGFHRTGNEHAFASNTYGDKITRGAGKTFLSLGRLPFNIGTNFTKYGAFAAAFLEHKLTDPYGVVGQKELGKIVARASLLDHNMSSAYSSKLHTGAFGIPMQFQAYDLRLAEMFYGPQLTPAEKARLFTSSLILYGIPGAAGMATLYPIGKSIATSLAYQGGYIPGDNPLADFMAHGGLAVLTKYLSGLGTYSDGTLYNFDKFGTKGIDPLEKLFNDGNIAELLAGPAGGVIMQSFQNSYGLRKYVSDLATSNGQYPIGWRELVDSFKAVTAVRSGQELWYALHYGKAISSHEVEKDYVSEAEAVLKYTLGLSPARNADMWAYQQSLSAAKQNIAAQERLATLAIQRAIRSQQDNDPESAIKYYRQAKILIEDSGVIPIQQQGAAWNRAWQSITSTERERILHQMFIDMSNNIGAYQKSMGVENRR